jgi:NADPH:quinone reductase-like Zn-dependent oxidoreductase
MVTPAGVELPSGADPLAVAAGMNPTMSAWMPLSARVREVGALGTVLVLGATGMAGRAAVQCAVALGATRVVAAGRDRRRLAEVEALGAVPVVLDGDASAGSLAAALDGEAPGIVIDYVWGPVAEAAFAALARRSLDDDTADIAYVQIGSLGGATAAVPSALLRSRRLSIRGSGFGSVSTRDYLAEIPRVLDLMAAGRIVLPYTAYPLERIAGAWTHSGADRAVVVP